MFAGLKSWWKKVLEKMEKSNEKQFGSGSNLDCCDLNSQKESKGKK